MANQNVLTRHSRSSDAHSISKWRIICGINLPISMMEMLFPIHVRESYPNYPTTMVSVAFYLERKGLNESIIRTVIRWRSMFLIPFSAESVQRSGRKSAASSKYCLIMMHNCWVDPDDGAAIEARTTKKGATFWNNSLKRKRDPWMASHSFFHNRLSFSHQIC